MALFNVCVVGVHHCMPLSQAAMLHPAALALMAVTAQSCVSASSIDSTLNRPGLEMVQLAASGMSRLC